MSHRPILKKRANKLRKALRSELPAFIDLVAYLKDRGHAQTTGEAHKLILAGRVRSESHKLGIAKGRKIKESSKLKPHIGTVLVDGDFEEVDIVAPLVSAKMRDTIQVMPA